VRSKKWLKGSAYTVRLPTGCVHCARGGKLVLLVTGKCRSGCFYCPLSGRKKGKSVIYADELRVSDSGDILEEARLIGATGTGVTGGDPLLDPSETARLIAFLKGEFGQRHHIHLYTGSADVKAVEKVASSGLDEIRFHPPAPLWGDIGKSRFKDALNASKDLGMEVGFEVPAIPGMYDDTLSLIESASLFGLSFVNLNELEFSETNWRELRRRGFDVRGAVSSAVRGSGRMALRLIAEAPAGLPVHYCSSSFKDAVQLRRRIMRRARNIRRPLDLLTKDGTRVMGIIESRDPAALVESLHERLGLPKRMMEANEGMRRVEIAPWILTEIAEDVGGRKFIIEEYPTADRLEVEREEVGVRRR